MAVLEALRQTPGALLRNPVLLVPPLVIMLFQIPQLLLQAIDPLLSSLVSLGLSVVFLFVMPFFQGGLIGMADEALDGRTSLGRFLGEGRANYVSILAAYLVLVAVNFALGVVAFFVAIFAGATVLGRGSGGPPLAILGVVVALVVVVALAYLLFVFFVQFYGQAIVIDDMGVVDGYRHSVSVVRHHLLSTLGYTVLVGIFGAVAGGVFAVGSLLASPRSATTVPFPHLPLVGVAVVAVLIVVIGSIFGGLFGVFSVAFYRAIDVGRGERPG
ncbi:MAG: hypothetical protein ABEJ81_06255 [Haloferacaceae archaeon]